MRKSIKTEVNGSLALAMEPEVNTSLHGSRAMCLTFLANARSNGFNERKLALLPTSLLHVDMSYQRETDETHVRDIIRCWDPNYCDDLTVSFRDNGKTAGFFVIDGQHRLEAAKRLYIDMLPCVVYEGKSLEWEADTYARQGTRRHELNSYDKFKANVTSRVENALAIKKICDEYSVRYYKSKKATTPILGGMSAIMRACDKHGADGVKWIFSTIDKLGWHNDRNAYCGTIIRALSNVYGAHTNKDEVQNQLIRNIDGKQHTPDETIIRARSERPSRGATVSLTQFFEYIITV